MFFKPYLKLFHQPVRSYSSRILHVTDSEGTRNFFETINKSTIVSYSHDQGLQFKPTNHTPYFIFGGDVTDRGHHDLAITTALVDFKKRHPELVTLLAGNRDIKNVRFIELLPSLIRERLLYSKPPRWIKQPTLPLDYVKATMAKKGLSFQGKEDIEDYVNKLSVSECQLIYLHWMLEKTMGCPHTFRYRKEELENQFPNKKISDEDVLNSFLFETSPEGLMGQYLRLSQVGFIVPNTRILAVHGGLTPYNIGRTPDMQPNDLLIENAQEWINTLNKWYALQIQKWIDFKGTNLQEPGFTELDDSVLPMPGKEKFIMTADMLGENRRFTNVAPTIHQYLKKNNISLVLTGHQPSGDHPAILRSKDILFINADTGYGEQGSKNADDTRGAVSHQLEISASPDESQVSIKATLSNARETFTNLTIKRDNIEGDPYIGQLLPDGNLVQSKLSNGNYRLAFQDGFEVKYSVINPMMLIKKLSEEFRDESISALTKLN